MYGEMIKDYFLPLFLSVTSIIGIIYFSKKFRIGLDFIEEDKPQKLHNEDIPRVGGLGILIGSLPLLLTNLGLLFFISSLPAFLAGFSEDLLENLKPKERLIIMTISALLAITLLDAVVYDIGYIKFSVYIAFLFTVVSIIGVINSINIIDGLNGLASGFSIIALLSFSIVFFQYGDHEMLIITLTLTFATIGFFLFNYPNGRIFLGDGGSYLLGFSLAVISILIVSRHPEISPWYPLVVMIYPIWEVLFSIYRRLILRNRDPLSPDKLHLHSLLFKRVFKNHYATLFILEFVSIFSFTAVLFKENTVILTILSIIFISLYILLYVFIVRFHGKKLIFPKIFGNSNFMTILFIDRKQE